jgi:hypothetical protein
MRFKADIKMRTVSRRLNATISLAPGFSRVLAMWNLPETVSTVFTANCGRLTNE